MTVKREGTEVFDLPPERVIEIVRSILIAGRPDYEYRDVTEADDGWTFHATIKPTQPGLLSSRIQVHINAVDPKTQVTVKTRSQWFSFGDVSDFYGSYIRDILGSTREGKIRDPKEFSSSRKDIDRFPLQINLAVNTVLVLAYFVRPSDPSWRIIGTIFILGLFIGFNFWWGKKYYGGLDPKIQKSIDLGRTIGMWNALIIGLIGLAFLLWVFVK